MTSPQFTGLRSALQSFANAVATQSSAHIGPLHRHLSERLVLEGGFPPEYILPRPPLRMERRGSNEEGWAELVFDPAAAKPGEQTILGGLKTKDVDVVVSVPGIGPCLAISVKGTLTAFRNLTNRMEEAAGDCTNLHMAYPSLVYGFLHVLRANRESNDVLRADAALDRTGGVVDSLLRYHDAMARITGRRDLRNDVSRYEAVCLALVEPNEPDSGSVSSAFPPPESQLRLERFFESLYAAYDLRYVYAPPSLKRVTRRLIWRMNAELVSAAELAGFRLRPE